jgi:hypothetical protein
LADVVEPCHVRSGFTASYDAFGNFPTLDRIQLRSSAADATFGPGGCETCRRAFADHRTFEFGEASDHLHHHPTRRVVVSMFSVIDRKPAPALPIRSMMCGRWRAGETLMERASPESFDRMVRLYNACGERPVEACTAAIAGQAATRSGETPPAKLNMTPSRPGAARSRSLRRPLLPAG